MSTATTQKSKQQTNILPQNEKKAAVGVGEDAKSIDEQIKAFDKASNVLSFLGNLVFGTGRGTPEQLAELRTLITTVRKYLSQIRVAYANTAQSGMFKPISDKLNAFAKQTEAAFASNNPRQVQRAVQQAGTVAAYATRFGQIHEDLAALIESHKDDLDSGDAGKIENVLKMMNNIIIRELTAVNFNKLGGVFKRLALVSKSLKLLPAPPGLTPQDFAKDYTDALRELLGDIGRSKAAEQEPAQQPHTAPQNASPAMVAESHRRLSSRIAELRLESLREYKATFSVSLQEVIKEQAEQQAGLEKFLAASAQIAKGIAQAQRVTAATPQQPMAQQGAAAQQSGALTPEQAKRVQVMLQNVSSVLGRLTPDQKKQFSQLLGQLKAAIG